MDWAILIYSMYKLEKILERIQIAFDNYKDYKTSSFELLRLNIVFDTVLRRYLIVGFISLASVYLLVFCSVLFLLDIGLSTAIFISVFILPVTMVFLFNSSTIFRSVRTKTER